MTVASPLLSRAKRNTRRVVATANMSVADSKRPPMAVKLQPAAAIGDWGG